MMVRFKGAGGCDQRTSQGSGSLKIEFEYPVLEIYAQADGANKFRIEFSERELPSLFDSRLFDVSSGLIPEAWRVTREWDGSLTFGPEEWSMNSFWEAFMDREDWAVELYKIGRTKSLERSL
ncbi:hypothetical protein [Frankia sp. Cr2]|uniref:hypothetical protein n=1 Tax=Frankia sp. Cr2 TaxID=3073932 RepID=UPI002AD40868|nr:hypothetical protein [Frankia sp. Cr2]